MDDIKMAEWAKWLEGCVRTLFEVGPVAIAMFARLPGGESMTAYCDAEPLDATWAVERLRPSVIRWTWTQSAGTWRRPGGGRAFPPYSSARRAASRSASSGTTSAGATIPRCTTCSGWSMPSISVSRSIFSEGQLKMEELKNLKAQQEAAERNAGAQAPCRPETCERLHTAKYIAELNQKCVCLSKELAAAVQEREADRRRLMEAYRQMRREPLFSSEMLGDMARCGYRCDEYTVLPDGSRRMHFGFVHDANDASQELRRSKERIEVLGRELETQAKETEEMRAELEWLREERAKLSQNYDALAALEANRYTYSNSGAYARCSRTRLSLSTPTTSGSSGP